jgi:hypothetical protein
MRFGAAIDQALLQLQLSRDQLLDRGDPCGLLLGVDEAIGYVGIPDEFRPFLSWGVDGVHDGLWIDDANQAHSPFVVMASPMDFSEPIRVEATDVKAWLSLVDIGDLRAPEWRAAARRAAEERNAIGLPPIVGEAKP